MIRFDEPSHTYRNSRGQLVPGVTFMLRRTGVARPVFPYMRKALARGKAVHKTIELFLRGELDLSSVDAVVMPYFECFLDWYGKHDKQFTRMQTEVVLEGPGGLYAGKADVTAQERAPSNARVVIDWKTGEEDPAHLIQDELYCLAETARTKKAAAPFVVYLWPKKSWKVVTPVEPARTMREALAVLDVFNLGRKRHMAWLAKEAGDDLEGYD